MSFTEKLQKSWIYTVTLIVISTATVTWSVAHALVVSPKKEDLERQAERIARLETALEGIKAQYDIPDSVIYDLGEGTPTSKPTTIATLNTELADLEAPLQTVIARNQTTQIQYPSFKITIATSDVQPDGATTFNVGYVLPTSEIPESLQFVLYPAQIMTVASSTDLKIFNVSLIASDPASKEAFIEVSTLEALRELLKNG